MSLACKWKGRTAWAPGSPGPCRGVSLSVESGLHELALRVSLDAAPAFLCHHSPVLRKARCRLWLGGHPPGVCTGRAHWSCEKWLDHLRDTAQPMPTRSFRFPLFLITTFVDGYFCTSSVTSFVDPVKLFCLNHLRLES